MISRTIIKNVIQSKGSCDFGLDRNLLFNLCCLVGVSCVVATGTAKVDELAAVSTMGLSVGLLWHISYQAVNSIKVESCLNENCLKTPTARKIKQINLS